MTSDRFCVDVPESTRGEQDGLDPIERSAYPSGPLSPRDILLGRPLNPRQVIATYSDDEYEVFVKEWASDGLGAQYAVVRRASGAGDMGRDVLGFVTPDLGSRGDSYDNALSESVVGPYKTEVIRQRGPW